MWQMRTAFSPPYTFAENRLITFVDHVEHQHQPIFDSLGASDRAGAERLVICTGLPYSDDRRLC